MLWASLATAQAPVLNPRCLECNALLAAAAPETVRDRVPPYTFATRREFWACTGCRRVFWAGTHVAGIRHRLAPYLRDARG